MDGHGLMINHKKLRLFTAGVVAVLFFTVAMLAGRDWDRFFDYIRYFSQNKGNNKGMKLTTSNVINLFNS